MTDREGVARLTRVVRPTDGAGLMTPPRPASTPGQPPTKNPNLLPQTGVARLTPKARTVESAAREFRQVMGRFATGVTVVTTVERDVIHGMTANGFLSVSLRPPLVLVSLGRCRMNELLPRSGRYGVSMLAQDQQHFAAHFAAQKSSPVEPTFLWQDGLPLLEGALAHLGCRVVDVHRAGDHVLWIGEVEYIDHHDDEPLLFYTGRFGTMHDIAERAERAERPG